MKLKSTKEVPAGKVLETLVTRPAELFDMTMRYADKLSETILPWEPAIIDRFMIPLYHGQYIIMQGRPGDAKTSLGLALGNMMGLRVKELGDSFPYGAPLFVTAETTKQHMGLYLAMERLNVAGKPNSVTGKAWNIEDVHRGLYNRGELLRGAMNLSQLNIDLLGQDADLLGMAIDVELVYRAVQELEAVGKRPVMIVMDYAQKMDAMSSEYVDSRNSRDAKIFEEVDQFTVATGIPVILMAQSNEWVDDLDVPIGTPGSVHGTSLAHRYAHTHIALCRPWNKKKWRTDDITGGRPSVVDTGWGKYPNKATTQILRNLKMRGKRPSADATDEIAVEFDVGRMTIKEIPEHQPAELDFNDMVNYDANEAEQFTQDAWHL